MYSSQYKVYLDKFIILRWDDEVFVMSSHLSTNQFFYLPVRKNIF